MDPDIPQLPLDHHYLAMHLGGPKRIERRGEGGVRTAETDTGALTIIPAGAAFDWHTQGPIEFAHIYFAPGDLQRISVEELDRDTRSIGMEDWLGVRDPLLQLLLFIEILDEKAGSTQASRL